ncbi:hypothetical protein [Robertmurraya siralis]|uniref:hypothetical protein n=1 Tax=Robertmurraya siralis TaxID=77777 RepID=UPI000BA64AF4|nr:hypothetical protein [Robertmurraya siralis]PAE18249.1 hypothetical protein CHH80_22660 [Bacillus sp. 7504-2]
MTDEQNAISIVMDFLHNKTKKTLLVRGYDNEAKLRVVLSCLNKEFDKGIIRTSSMSDILDHINGAFNKNLLPYTVKSTTIYKLGRMKVNINSYSTHTKSNPKGNEGTFTVFYPVQFVLDDYKRYINFLRELNNIKSSKIILITTNEWSIKERDIENHMDQVFFYSVENDNPQIMSNLRNNGAI